MPKYVIEREIPGAAELFAKEKRAVSQKSNAVLKELGRIPRQPHFRGEDDD